MDQNPQFDRAQVQTRDSRALSQMPYRRVAIVHDWLVTYAGAERVVRELLKIFPDADLFSIVDFLPDKDREKLFGKRAKTSFVQRLPMARKKYRGYLALMPMAIEQFDLSSYDLVISSSHAVAKGVLTGPDQMHVCYCHTPIRYAWDLQHQYLAQARLVRGLKSMIARMTLHYMRIWDSRTSHGVDAFVANSGYIGRRIKKSYGREAIVIYPPVDTESFVRHDTKEDFYLTASRMVPYKMMDVIVAAFAGMPERKLVVIGDGPEMEKIKKIAAPNVILMGYQENAVLRDHLQRAKAFVFAAEEDFGILPVEAQACGTPVIAYGRGGALETVVDAGNREGAAPTGIFFGEQTPDAIRNAVERFEQLRIRPEDCRIWAEGFSAENFRRSFTDFICAQAA